MSVVRRPVPPLVTLAAGVAAAQACLTVAGAAVTLKWPNDVLTPVGKVGGILSELVGDAVVVGLGLNVDWRSPLPPGAASLGPGVDRGLLLTAWLTALDEPGDVLAEYRARCSTLGRRVRVELPAGAVEGIAEAVADDGSLVVDGRKITAGDVIHLR